MHLVYLTDLLFADDIMIVVNNKEHLRYNLQVWYDELQMGKMKMSKTKT